MKKHDNMGIMFIIPYLLIFSIFQLYPIVNTLYLSFTSYDGGYTDPKFIGVENYYKTMTPAQDIKNKNDVLEEKLLKEAVEKYNLKERDVAAVLKEYGITDKEIKENDALFSKIQAEKKKFGQVEYLNEKLESEKKRVEEARNSIALTIRTTKDNATTNFYSLERKRVGKFQLKKLKRSEVDAKYDIKASDKEFMEKVTEQRKLFLKHEALTNALDDKEKFPMEIAELKAELKAVDQMYDAPFVKRYKIDIFAPDEVEKNFTIDAQLAFLKAIETEELKRDETRSSRGAKISGERAKARKNKASLKKEIAQIEKSFDKEIVSKYNVKSMDLVEIQTKYDIFDKTFIAKLEEQKAIVDEMAKNQSEFETKNEKAESRVIALKSELGDLESQLATIRSGIYRDFLTEYKVKKSRLDDDKAKVNAEIREINFKRRPVGVELDNLESEVRAIEKKIVRLSKYEYLNGKVKVSPKAGKEAEIAQLQKERDEVWAEFKSYEEKNNDYLRQINAKNEQRAKIEWSLAGLNLRKNAYKKENIPARVFKKSSGVADIVATYCANDATSGELSLISQQFDIWQEIKKNQNQYRGVFMDPYFWQSFGNTVRIWIPNIIIQLALAFFVSVLFTDVRLRIKGVSLFRAIFYFPNLVMYASIALLFNVLFDFQNGAINQIIFGEHNEHYINWMLEGGRAQMIVSLIQAWMWFGNSVIFIMAGLNGIPDTYYEAAVVDGANGWQTFWKITIPLIRPVLVYISITSLIGGMQIFDLPQVLTNGSGFPDNKLTTMTMHLFKTGFRYDRMGYAAAIAYVIFLILVAFSILSLRVMNEDTPEQTRKKQEKKLARIQAKA